MSVLIKGMKMPKACGLCPFDDYGYCTRMKQYSGGSATHGRASFCPLVELPEKHGRLIDADKLFDAMKYSNWKVLFSSDGTFLDISKFSEIIRNIPTVVEAEGEMDYHSHLSPEQVRVLKPLVEENENAIEEFKIDFLRREFER